MSELDLTGVTVPRGATETGGPGVLSLITSAPGLPHHAGGSRCDS